MLVLLEQVTALAGVWASSLFMEHLSDGELTYADYTFGAILCVIVWSEQLIVHLRSAQDPGLGSVSQVLGSVAVMGVGVWLLWSCIGSQATLAAFATLGFTLVSAILLSWFSAALQSWTSKMPAVPVKFARAQLLRLWLRLWGRLPLIKLHTKEQESISILLHQVCT